MQVHYLGLEHVMKIPKQDTYLCDILLLNVTITIKLKENFKNFTDFLFQPPSQFWQISRALRIGIITHMTNSLRRTLNQSVPPCLISGPPLCAPHIFKGEQRGSD